MQTIKDIQRTIKKLNKQINFQKSITKSDQDNHILTRLEEVRDGILKVLDFRTKPENAKRCALPKRIQRQKGPLPAI